MTKYKKMLKILDGSRFACYPRRKDKEYRLKTVGLVSLNVKEDFLK
jgi:hypothetical protein